MARQVNRRRTRRPRPSIAFAAATAAFLALFAGGCTKQNIQESEYSLLLPPQVRAAAADTSGTRVLTTWSRSLDRPRRWTADTEDSYAPDISSDGRHLAWVADGPDGPRILTLDLPPEKPGPSRALTDDHGRQLAPRFSPDGARIAYLSTLDDAFGDLWIVSRQGGTPRRVTDRTTRDDSFAWMPDGKRLVVAAATPDSSPTLVLVTPATGERESLPTGPAIQPDVAPDGRLIVFVRPGSAPGLDPAQPASMEAAGTLALFDTVTREVLPLPGDGRPGAAQRPRFAPDGKGIIYTRFCDDTNADGRLDRLDNATVWRMRFDPVARRVESEYPLTSAATDSRDPAPFLGGFFYARDSRTHRGDLYSMPRDGAVGRQGRGAATFFDSAAWLETERPAEADLLICAWRQIEGDRVGDATPELRQRALLNELRIHSRLGRLDQAASIAQRLLDDAATAPLVRALAEVERERISVALVDRETQEPTRRAAVRSLARARVERTLADPATPPEAAAEGRLLAAQFAGELGDPAAAVAHTDAVNANTQIPSSLHARALLLRGGLQERLGLSSEVAATYRRVIAEHAEQRREAFEAARRIIDVLTRNAAGDDERARRLNALLADPSTPPVLAAAAQNRIGDLLAAADRLSDALDAYRITATRFPNETEAVAASHFAQSQVLFDQGRYDESVRVYERIERRLRPRDDVFYDRARRGYIRQTLLKAESEWRGNDPALARATFSALLSYDPANYEAWRGILRSDDVLGRIPETLAELDALLSTSRPDDANAATLLYARALALTYLPGAADQALQELEGVALLDPASPYPHQTIGYLYEQKALAAADDSDPATRSLHARRAIQEYQLALALTDRDLTPLNAANLLVNTGRAARLLDLWGLAQSYFAERVVTGLPFETPANEFLFWSDAGQAAFYAGDSRTAAAHYEKALSLLDAARAQDKGRSGVDWNEKQTELIDRRALALQEAGQSLVAASLFAEVERRAAEDPQRRALAIRNRAVNLYLAAQDRRGEERTALLRDAWTAFRQSRATLDANDEQARRAAVPKGAGFFGFAAVVGLGQEATGSGMGFDSPAERRLLEGFLGWISENDRDPDAASAAIQRQLSTYPKVDDKNRAYIFTEKAILHSRLAALDERRGSPAAAARQTLLSLSHCRWTANKQTQTNVRGSVVAALNVARLWVLDPTVIDAGQLRRSWLFDPAANAPAPPDDSDAATPNDAQPAPATAEDVARLLANARALLEPAPPLPPPTAAVLLPEVLFHQGAIALRQAIQHRDAAPDPADPLSALRQSTDMMIAANRARAHFAAATARIVRESGSARPPFPVSGEDRERRRRIEIASRFQQIRASRLLAPSAEVDAFETQTLALARAWRYDDLLFGAYVDAGLETSDPAARLRLWHEAAAVAENALPGQRSMTPMARAARATIAAAFVRDEATKAMQLLAADPAAADAPAHWQAAWEWGEWPLAQDLAALIDDLAPTVEAPDARRALLLAAASGNSAAATESAAAPLAPAAGAPAAPPAWAPLLREDLQALGMPEAAALADRPREVIRTLLATERLGKLRPGLVAAILSTEIPRLQDEIRQRLTAWRRFEVLTSPADEALLRDTESLAAQWQELLKAAYDSAPDLWALYSGKPYKLDSIIDLAHVGEAYATEGRALVRLQWLGDSVLVLAFGPRNFEGRLVPDTLGELRSYIARAAKGEPTTPQDLQLLTKYLWVPLRVALDDVRDITLSADGVFVALPVEAAPDPVQAEGSPAPAAEPVFTRWNFTWALSSAHMSLSRAQERPWKNSVLRIGSSDNDTTPRFASTTVFAAARPAYEVLAAGRAAQVLDVRVPVDLDPRDPAGSALRTSAPAEGDTAAAPGSHVTVRDLFSAGWSDLSCVALAKPIERYPATPIDRIAATNVLLMALGWSGAPSVALGPTATPAQPANASVRFPTAPADLADPAARAWELAIDDLATSAPGAAFQAARIRAWRSGINPATLAFWRVWGSPGISGAAAREYAETEFRAALGEAKTAERAKDTARVVRALAKLLELQTRINPQDSEVAELAERLAVNARSVGEYELGIRAADRLIEFRERTGSSLPDLSNAYRFRGLLNSMANRHERAIAAMRHALELAAKAEDTERQLKTMAELGIVLENAERYSESLEAFAATQKFAADLESPQYEAPQWRRIGRILFLRLGRFSEAAEAFAKARDLFAAAEDPRGRAESILDLGQVAERQGIFDRSLALYDEASTIALQLNDPALLSRTSLNRANTHWLSGNYLDCLTQQRRALELATAARSPELEIASRNTAGLLFWALNDFDRAQTEFELALDLSRRSDIPSEEASTLNNLGLVERSRANYPAALARFSAALALDTRMNNRWGIAYDHRNIGMTHLLSGDAATARTHLLDAARIAESIGDAVNFAKALLSLADAERALANPAAARESYARAIDIARTRRIPEVEWRALYGLALLEKTSGNRPAAIARLDEGIKVVERMRASIRVEELQDGFLADKQSLYEEMVVLLLDDNRPKDAFEFSERARGRSFIDLLGNQKLQVNSAADQALIDREREARLALERIEREFAALAPGDPTYAAQQAAVRTAEAALQDAVLAMRTANPGLSAFVTVDPITLEEIQKLLAGEATLLSFLLTEKETVVWIVKTSALEVVRIPMDRAALVRDVTEYRRRIQGIENTTELSRKLYAQLIRPLESAIADSPRLAIVPHNILHYLAFASLETPSGEALIDRHSLFYLPSSSVYRYTRARRPVERNLRVLAIGNPDLGTRALDLPFAQKEAERLAWNFPEVEVLTGSRATETWLRENISRFGIIHLAMHGEFDSRNPLFSRLLMAPAPGSDGNLTVRDIFALSVGADLVTLSACQSGLAKINNGDDLVGLNRAFVYAGTHTLIATLWRVDDVATAVLIKHFYRGYLKTDKAEALRAAMVQVRRQQPHPAYWSGIVLTGDWN